MGLKDYKAPSRLLKCIVIFLDAPYKSFILYDLGLASTVLSHIAQGKAFDGHILK